MYTHRRVNCRNEWGDSERQAPGFTVYGMLVCGWPKIAENHEQRRTAKSNILRIACCYSTEVDDGWLDPLARALEFEFWACGESRFYWPARMVSFRWPISNWVKL